MGLSESTAKEVVGEDRRRGDQSSQCCRECQTTLKIIFCWGMQQEAYTGKSTAKTTESTVTWNSPELKKADATATEHRKVCRDQNV